MARLILVRHGQSEWNKKNIFTGWVDIPLSLAGVEEAFQAGRELAEIPIDCIFTSTLMRGIMTAFLIMNVHSSEKIPVILHDEKERFASWRTCFSQETKDHLIPVTCAWELNERMYGKLQGLNKQTMRELYGENQVELWRRSYKAVPPDGESLEMTKERALPYFKNVIVPHLREGKEVMVVAHGNSLRSILMELDNLDEEEIVKLEIPTGKPLMYQFSQERFTKIL